MWKRGVAWYLPGAGAPHSLPWAPRRESSPLHTLLLALKAVHPHTVQRVVLRQLQCPGQEPSMELSLLLQNTLVHPSSWELTLSRIARTQERTSLGQEGKRV